MKKGKKTKKTKATKKPAAKILNTSGVTPLGDRVLVSPAIPESVTSFGLIIPETADKEKAETGVVVAVGPGKMGDNNALIPVGVSVGDKILFNKYGYDEVKVAGKEYYLVSEQNILAILKK